MKSPQKPPMPERDPKLYTDDELIAIVRAWAVYLDILYVDKTCSAKSFDDQARSVSAWFREANERNIL